MKYTNQQKLILVISQKNYYQLFSVERYKMLIQDEASMFLNCTFGKQMNNR